jgi:hypothetical protein
MPWNPETPRPSSLRDGIRDAYETSISLGSRLDVPIEVRLPLLRLSHRLQAQAVFASSDPAVRKSVRRSWLILHGDVLP